MKMRSRISKLTLEEKSALVSGSDFWRTRAIDRLGIPAIMMTDGPHGLRKEEDGGGGGLTRSVPATCFPTASCLASTWNRDLVFQVGRAIAEEALEEGVSVVLGPGANIKRSPLCGRNFEYFSEDPFLSGEMAKSWISGAQSLGVGASLKHYAVNNQESRRMTINAVVDERALREIYLAGFETAVREAQPWTVMAAYNQVNGHFCAENPILLNQILRKEWGFEGLLMSDWGATNDRIAGLNAGLDLEMPGVPNGNSELVAAAVRSGILDEAVLEQAVDRVLALVERSQVAMKRGFQYDRDAHQRLARQAAAEGAVLLKNRGGLLPLKPDMKVALIGEFAWHPRYQGSGSSFMNPNRLDTLVEEMAKIAVEGRIAFAPGYSIKDDKIHPQLIEEAVRVAREADVVVVHAGLTDMAEVEGVDRDHLCLPASHDALIEAIAAACPKLVVVLSNGAPVEMPWHTRVSAILEGYLGGQAGAGALADILYGKTSPGGKLAETFPLRLEDNPSFHCFPGGPRTVEYRESIYVGYRYYDQAVKDVLFPFGHGLSYTTFEYAELRLSKKSINADENIKVSFKVRNTGAAASKEIAQIYVRDPESSVFRPEKELKGFVKLDLKPAEEQMVEIELAPRAFAFYNPETGRWEVEAGEFEILVGASSRDIRLADTVRVIGEAPGTKRLLTDRIKQYHHLPVDANFRAIGFEELLERTLPENSPEKRGGYTINTPINDMRNTLVGRWLAAFMRKELAKLVEGFEDTPNALMMEKIATEAPLRTMLMSAGGQINRGMLAGLLLMINGKIIKGLSQLLKSRKPRK